MSHPVDSRVGSTRSLARSRAYGLLGDLLRRGLREEHLGVLGHVHELAATLRVPYREDEEAAIHYALFGHEIFPFESAFREVDDDDRGRTITRVAGAYGEAGFDPRCTSDAPDHVGRELAFLGFLSRLESHDTNALSVAALRERQRAFLDEHLLVWLPALSVAVRMRADRFWASVVELTLNLALAHRSELGVAASCARKPAATGEGMASLLDASSTGLRDIAELLLAPARSGLLITRADIAALGRGLGLPRGFGGRRLMLTTLLRSAIEYERLADLLAGLDAQLVEWLTVLDEYRALWPTAGRFLAVWSGRITATRELLDVIERRASDEALSAALG